MDPTAVNSLIETLLPFIDRSRVSDTFIHTVTEVHLAMEKEQMLDFGEFIIDELEPMAQNREWVEERYNYFKSE